MKILFLIQGEGRGHLTQALSLAQLLHKNGIELCAVGVGKSNRRDIPLFFSDKINAPIFRYESPNFITDKSDKGIKIGHTIVQNVFNYKRYKKSLRQIDSVLATTKPDVIINFYELLGGVYNFLYQPKCQFWVIGHQFFLTKPYFKFPKGHLLQKLFFKLHTRITALGAHQQIALSFQENRNQSTAKLQILPPLLRQELQDVEIKNQDFYLVYMVNHGYAEEVIQFAANHPDIQLVAFWDCKEAANVYKPLPNLCFHQLNDLLFLEKMASCKALVCTAGFESVCEAMYLDKPVMMIPVKGQFEQLCNAKDAVTAGAGISSKHYNILKIQAFVDSGKFEKNNTKEWVHQFEDIFLALLAASFSENTVSTQFI